MVKLLTFRLIGLCWLLALLNLFMVPSLFADEPLPLYRVGIVTDGDTAWDRETAALFRKEITTLAEGEFRVRFPRSMQLSGGDTAAGTKKALDRLLANPETDLVLALGLIASNEVFRRKALPKPVVVPFVSDSITPDIPRQGNSSGVPNLAYIDSRFLVDQEVLNFQKIVPFKNLALLVDRRDVEAIPGIRRFARRLANEFTITVNLVEVGDSAEAALAAIPPDTEAVMVGFLYHLSDEQIRLLLQGFIKRRLPSYTLWSKRLVEMGVLAGDVPDDIQENLARRTAVTVQDILLGEEADTLNIAFARGSALTINMATARSLDIYPGLAVMTGATLLHEKQHDIKRRLTLQQVVQEALQTNLDLQSAGRRVRAGEHAVAEARSPLLPRIDVATGARAVDADRARLSGGTSPERAWTGSASGRQQIYSERSWAAYSVEQHNQAGRVMDRESVRLDVIYQASVAYFDVLRAKTIEQLYKDNLKLTQANLDRARIRMSTGVAGPDEVYRWETKFAQDRIEVLKRESITLDAMEALNRILHRPLEELFIAEETDLSDPLLMVSDQLFYQMMNNPKYLRNFRRFAVGQALRLRPELKAIDAAIAAKQREKTAAAREIWLPEFTIEGNVDQYFAEDGAGQRGDIGDGLDDTDWQVGVFARLPLFEGGRKTSALNRTREELARLKIEHAALAERIGQNVLSALNRTRASYPGISLSREAADAARRNLNLIMDSYVQGIKSIIDLLDAQNQALAADQTAANAVYNFLVDLMGVERAMGEFVTFLPDEQRKQWQEKAKKFMHQQLAATATAR